MKQKDIKRLERVLNYFEKAEYELETLKVNLEKQPTECHDNEGMNETEVVSLFLLDIYRESRLIHSWWWRLNQKTKQ